MRSQYSSLALARISREALFPGAGPLVATQRRLVERERHGRYSLEVMRHSVLSTTPTAEKPALSDEERAERRRRLAERVFSPGGLDRDTLKHIEQLTGNES